VRLVVGDLERVGKRKGHECSIKPRQLADQNGSGRLS